jgi:regulator of RNase E activity RraA
VDRLGDDRHACWDGGATTAAQAAGVCAGVADGPRAILEEIEASAFPVWCRGFAPITTRLYDLGGRVNMPVCLGGLVIMPGDGVLCDDRGVLAMPPHEAEAEARGPQTPIGRAGGAGQANTGAHLGVLSGARAKVIAGARSPG